MRLFLAIPAPESPRYAELARDIQAAMPQARPVPAGSWHATLRFLGEVADWRPLAAAVRPVVAATPRARLAMRGVGAFPSPRKARVVWAGMHADGLGALAAAVAAATPLAHDPERGRPFHAHVTLARLDPPGDASAFASAHASETLAKGTMDSVVLYSSQLTPSGPVYRPLETFPLGSQAPAF
ncbi:MAG: RNA 2',3'-cyclic phosphodiesterase [Halobacteriales archaeon]|nr:RNA 2',3'-cyclic phosphodiesterase [Halobacteriales archaeon]